MTLQSVILLNPTTIRLTIDFSGTVEEFDFPIGQITALDALTFATWAQTNLVQTAPPAIPTWLKDLEGMTL